MTAEQKVDGIIDRSQLRKSVLMPSQETMVVKLKAIKLVGDNPKTTDKFYSRLVESLSGKKVNAAELNVTWNLTTIYLWQEIPPEVRAKFSKLIDLDFAQAINAITPDLQVASAAVQFRKEVASQSGELWQGLEKILRKPL